MSASDVCLRPLHVLPLGVTTMGLSVMSKHEVLVRLYQNSKVKAHKSPWQVVTYCLLSGFFAPASWVTKLGRQKTVGDLSL
jgi:hypothetical protein